MAKKTRIETDSMGRLKSRMHKYWGAQTQRSIQNFPIGTEKMPIELIRALALSKKLPLLSIIELGLLSCRQKDLIVKTCDELLCRKTRRSF